MNLSNLFEGAVDELERRRIEDLEMKMDDLARRAKETTDPKVIAALRHEFAKCKAERDSYHYVQEWEDTAPGHDRNQTELTPVKETWNYATPWGKEAAIKQKATISRPASTSNDEVKTFAAQGYTIKFKPDVVEIYHGADLVYSKPGDFANPTRAQLGAIRGRVTDLANRAKKEVEEAGSPAQQAAIAINMKKHNQKPKTDEAATDYQKRRQRERDVDMGKPVGCAPKNPQTDYAKKRAQDKRDMELGEAEERLRVSPHDQGSFAAVKGKPYDSNPHPKGSKEHLEWSKGHNAMRARKADLDEHGGGNAGPREWHNYVRAHRADEGFQDFNKVEPYAVCLAGKPIKKFDYYEEARRFHDNWKQKLYREGNKEKADKITLLPLDIDEGSMTSAEHHNKGPEFTGYWKGTDSGTPGDKMVGCEESKEFKVPAARNFVAKNAKTGGAGQHKDAKRAMKQGDVKHKARAIPMDMEEGAKVDRMQKHIAKSEKDLGHSKKDAEAIGWATLNKRGYLDNANKKKHNESVNFMEWAVAQGSRFPNFTGNPEVYAQAKEAFLAEGMSNALSNITRRMAQPSKPTRAIKNRENKKDTIKRTHFAEDEVVDEDYVSEIKKGQKDSNGNTSCWTGYHAQGTKKSSTTGKQVRNCVPNESVEETAAWQKKSGKNKNGGLNAKGVKSYRREHPGSKLQTAVTTKPSKLKKGSKAAKRRKSFCARMSGVKGPMKKPNGKPTRKALALRKWNCEGVENLDAMLAEAIEKGTLQPGQYYIWTVYFDDGSKQRIKVTKDNFDPKAYYSKQNKVVINVDYNWEAHNG